MMETVLTAALLGALAGGVPGPYTTALVGTAVGRGLRPALPLVLVPLVTDVPPMLVTAALLDRMNETFLGVVGVLGGLLLVGLGVRFVRRRGDDGEGGGGERGSEEGSTGQGGSGNAGGEDDRTAADFRQLATAGLLSPAPWFFWLVAASPLLLRAWHRSPVRGVVFVVVLFATLLATGALVAWAAARGRSLLGSRARTRIFRGAGVLLVLAGAFVAWRSLEGDFASLIERQEQIREAVD